MGNSKSWQINNTYSKSNNKEYLISPSLTEQVLCHPAQLHKTYKDWTSQEAVQEQEHNNNSFPKTKWSCLATWVSNRFNSLKLDHSLVAICKEIITEKLNNCLRIMNKSSKKKSNRLTQNQLTRAKDLSQT